MIYHILQFVGTILFWPLMTIISIAQSPLVLIPLFSSFEALNDQMINILNNVVNKVFDLLANVKKK